MTSPNHSLRADGSKSVADRLMVCDVDGALVAFEQWACTPGDVEAPSELVPLAQLALLLGQSLPVSLKAFLDAQQQSGNEDVSRLAMRVLESIADGGRQLGRSEESAAYALLWTEHARPSLVSRYLLIESTLLADGHEAAQWLLESILDDHEQSGPYAQLITARCAFARREWKRVIDSAGACLETGGWIGRQALSPWMKALIAQGDEEAALGALCSLPEELQSRESLSLQASLLWECGDQAAARDHWVRALGDGWRDFDRSFAEAIGTLDWEPEQLYLVAEAQPEAVQRDVCVALAGRSDLTPEVLDILMEVDLTDVRVALAGNSALSVDALRSIAKAGAFEAIAVAENASIPGELLAELASRPEASVRRAAASSARCPIDVLEVLASDAEPVVLMAVRDNPVCPDTLRVQVALML